MYRKDRPVISLEDLAPVDDFHVGGREATLSVLSKLNLGSPVQPETASKKSEAEEEDGEGKVNINKKLDATTIQKKYLIDVGCGIGGTCRVAASTFGCHAVGVDLDGASVDCGNTITR